jgi:hypothetical protein
MKGNGFGWGQFSHTFGWVYMVTGLTPKSVYCVAATSPKTGADLFDAVVVTCTNGCTISVRAAADAYPNPQTNGCILSLPDTRWPHPNPTNRRLYTLAP